MGWRRMWVRALIRLLTRWHALPIVEATAMPREAPSFRNRIARGRSHGTDAVRATWWNRRRHSGRRRLQGPGGRRRPDKPEVREDGPCAIDKDAHQPGLRGHRWSLSIQRTEHETGTWRDEGHQR